MMEQLAGKKVVSREEELHNCSQNFTWVILHQELWLHKAVNVLTIHVHRSIITYGLGRGDYTTAFCNVCVFWFILPTLNSIRSNKHGHVRSSRIPDNISRVPAKIFAVFQHFLSLLISLFFILFFCYWFFTVFFLSFLSDMKSTLYNNKRTKVDARIFLEATSENVLMLFTRRLRFNWKVSIKILVSQLLRYYRVDYECTLSRLFLVDLQLLF